MHPARIAELLEPFLPAAPPDDALYQHISTHIDILLRWNTRINLTAIRDPEQIVTRHFGESLFAACHLFPMASSVPPVTGACPDAGRVGRDFDSSAADLGSGAGFPGIPIKLWAPHLALTLIESNHKKTAFLREIVRALTLTDVNVFAGRAQEFLHPGAGRRSGFDLVTLRAVECFHNILPVAASLVSPGGRLALLIGTSQSDVARSSLPTLTWAPSTPIPLSQSRILLIGHESGSSHKVR